MPPISVDIRAEARPTPASPPRHSREAADAGVTVRGVVCWRVWEPRPQAGMRASLVVVSDPLWEHATEMPLVERVTFPVKWTVRSETDRQIGIQTHSMRSTAAGVALSLPIAGTGGRNAVWHFVALKSNQAP